jgi:hypothetical protein
MKKKVSRRKFMTAVSAGTASTIAVGGVNIFGKVSSDTDKLAILGGKPLRTRRFTPWPPVNKDIEDSIVSVLRSRKWCRKQG